MCETNVFIDKNGDEELFMENVDVIRPDDGKILLKNLFGEENVFEGSIKEISLKKHRIILTKEKK